MTESQQLIAGTRLAKITAVKGAEAASHRDFAAGAVAEAYASLGGKKK